MTYRATMSKIAMRQPKFFRRLLMFVDRRLIWCSVNMGLCAVVVSVLAAIFGFLGLALVVPWNAIQLGPVSGYLAAAVTVTAVTVALRQSAQARTLADDALLAAKVRAEIDRDFGHRRETTNQIIAMWTEISNIEPLLVIYSAYRSREGRSGQGVESYTSLIQGLHRASTAMFAAQAITLSPDVVKELQTLQEKIASFKKLALDLETPLDDWRKQSFSAWAKIIVIKEKFPQILREHLPLLESAEEENKRMKELKGNVSSFNSQRLRTIIGKWLETDKVPDGELIATVYGGAFTKVGQESDSAVYGAGVTEEGKGSDSTVNGGGVTED